MIVGPGTFVALILITLVHKLEVILPISTRRNRYPYHQPIGFLLERAGYEPWRLAPLRKLAITFDLHLAHGTKERDYDPGWRLFFPKGM